MKPRRAQDEAIKRLTYSDSMSRRHISQESTVADDLRRRARRRARLEEVLFLVSLASLFLLFRLAQAASPSSPARQFFEVQPEPQYMVQNGADIRLRCLVRHRQGDCLWLRNGRALGVIAKKYHFARNPDDGDCSIQIRNASVQLDDGTWQCQVTPSEIDQETLQTREVQLIVLVAPEKPQIKNMSQGTQRLILEENKSKVVVCEMRGGNPAPQIEWLLDNKNISREATTSTTTLANQNGNGNQNTRLTQSRLKMSDIKRTMNGKNLTCVGVHPTGNQSASVELDVQYVPTVSVVQREYSIVEGSPLSINCQVDANPPPNLVNWRLVSDGALAGGRSSATQASSPSSNGLTLPTRPGPVLEFERISRDLNQNIFQCLAQNSYGISLPADVKLNVLYAPYLLNTSNSESVQVGSQAQLACLFDGNPEPEVKWFYSDPLSRSNQAVQLEASPAHQYLTINNVSYRNEGDYHCEARNQINGVFYGVRSSNIILDVFGEPQFLVKSPLHSKAIQGTKSDIALTFCSDPAPNKVYWQFGSLRLDVRLDNINRPDSSPHQRHQPQAPSGGQGASAAAIKQMSQRFQVHPLQSLQKRDSSFSKAATCFEAQLSLLDPELTDQRDYTLVVQNERGHQSALVRLRVATPLSPVLMISSAFVTICGLFLCSLVVMFLLKKRSNGTARSDGQSGGASNGATANGSHQANGQQLAGEKGAKDPNAMEHQQHTRGVVNGLGNGMANQASNPNGAINKQLIVDELAAGKHLLSMGASSDSSANDHKQLLGAVSSSSSTADRNCSSGSAPPSSMSSSSAATTNPCGLMDPHASYHSTGTAHSTASSSPTPMNHVSVEEEDSLALGGPPGSRHAYLTDQPSGLSGYSHEHNALIYANLDYSAPNTTSNSISTNTNSIDGAQYSPMAMQSSQQHRRQQTPMAHSPAISNLSASIDSQSADQFQSQTGTMRPSVGATIAMMNNLAAQQQLSSSPGAGCLNGAISQQLANNRLIRKPGPPKPPKPTIQQRSRFYSQQASQSNGANSNNNGLVMIGTQQTDAYGNVLPHDPSGQPSAKELAVEYSRLAFPARAEL